MAALSIWSSVVNRPVDNRIVPIATSIGIFIASNTLDMVTESLWQAAPADAATVSRESSISFAFRPLKLMLNVLGSLLSGWPLTCASEVKILAPERNNRRNIKFLDDLGGAKQTQLFSGKS